MICLKSRHSLGKRMSRASVPLTIISLSRSIIVSQSHLVTYIIGIYTTEKNCVAKNCIIVSNKVAGKFAIMKMDQFPSKLAAEIPLFYSQLLGK